MFSTQSLNVFEANGYQYWPTWMVYGLQNFNGFTPAPIPFNFVPMDSVQIKEEANVSEKQSPPTSPKLGFIECRSKEKSQTTNYQENSKNSQDLDLDSGNGQSSFICKKKKMISKKKKSKKGCQNKNRNIIPNIIQQIFSFLSKPTKSKPNCQRIFDHLPKPESNEVSIQRYYYFIKQVKERLNHYVNEKSLIALCKVQEIGIDLFNFEEQMFYLKLARILAKHFIEEILPFLIIHSKRMFDDKRAEHMRIRRSLLQVLENLGC